MKPILLSCLITLFLAGCAHSPSAPQTSNAHPLPAISAADQRALLIGTWYGHHQTDDGSLFEEISVMKSDGTFSFSFRLIENNGAIDKRGQLGYWGIAGDIHFTILRADIYDGQAYDVDPTDAAGYQAYQVIELSQDKFTYRSITSGRQFTLERVEKGFGFLESI